MSDPSVRDLAHQIDLLKARVLELERAVTPPIPLDVLVPATATATPRPE